MKMEYWQGHIANKPANYDTQKFNILGNDKPIHSKYVYVYIAKNTEQ